MKGGTSVLSVREKNGKPIKTLLVMVICLFTLFFALPDPALAQGAPANVFERIDIPSSFNPVGSGARALGMGGAFIAIADDATAASWNPGGLIQLERPEISMVGAYLYRTETNEWGTNPEANGAEAVSNLGLNYLSAAYPFVVLDHNMIVSLNYQHLFDLHREWNFDLSERFTFVSGGKTYVSEQERKIDIEQTGGLYALGIAYCVQILPTFSFGFTLNFWEDLIYDNEWKKTTSETRSGITRSGFPYTMELTGSNQISFSGFNFNLGLLWQVTDRLTIGAVFKSPFTADVKDRATNKESTIFPTYPKANEYFYGTSTNDQELDMPMSYGIGIAYRFSDEFSVSADIYRTEWEDFVLRDSSGDETAPTSGLPVEESEIDATHQVRLGAEYLFVKSKYVVPVRAGLFYDPAPAEKNPDDYFGFSVGSGIGFDRFSFDMAYQYRFGRDVGASILKAREFSQDLDEHTIYASVIVYF